MLSYLDTPCARTVIIKAQENNRGLPVNIEQFYIQNSFCDSGILFSIEKRLGNAISQLINLHKAVARKLITLHKWEVVVAQLVEWSLLIPEVRGSTPVIGKILLNICLLTCLLSAVLKR